jgi:hypothetical protein
MWKIVVVLLLTALAILGARIAYEPSLIYPHLGGAAAGTEAQAPVTPPLMYAGIRG